MHKYGCLMVACSNRNHSDPKSSDVWIIHLSEKGPYWSNCKWYALSALERLQECCTWATCGHNSEWSQRWEWCSTWAPIPDISGLHPSETGSSTYGDRSSSFYSHCWRGRAIPPPILRPPKKILTLDPQLVGKTNQFFLGLG